MIVKMQEEATIEQIQAVLEWVGPQVVIANLEVGQPSKIVIRGYRDKAHELMAQIRTMPGVAQVGITGV